MISLKVGRLVMTLAAIIGMMTMVASAQPNADTAIQRLIEGNLRYARGNNRALVRSTDRPQKLNKMQAPFAMILGCADSRVAPELAFDQPWGSLFTVRVAGNISEPYLLGSIEYAILTFHTPVLVVLGHDSCGAVDAALNNAAATGNLKTVVDAIHPAIAGKKTLQSATDANVRYAINQVQANSPVVAEAVKAGKLRIVGGVYTFKTGKIRWLK